MALRLVERIGVEAVVVRVVGHCGDILKHVFQTEVDARDTEVSMVAV